MLSFKQLITFFSLFQFIFATVKGLPATPFFSAAVVKNLEFGLTFNEQDIPGAGTFLISTVASSNDSSNSITLKKDSSYNKLSDSLSSNYVNIGATTVVASYHYTGSGNVILSYNADLSSEKYTGSSVKFVGSFIEDSVDGKPVDDVYNFITDKLPL
ncbi:putative secreted protein [Wickerhamomyces ciferrii]|uniref:Secreted protein n=1 Tax=Wickerhamomyces ciferrii (strain ATCC 14091 / BCRC 22168 / CBS 111 / JCM 3599 / NBRC 0793 / NRRL Y-1031 F-60-10) TaxID=1206466 RepID=K0KSW0_WICCF|nr:uncharacterized protein BN7_5837 [Wickerhamomyces ciferrii]CCH46246.1 putative secreted protein [Wickerhamomyces ciferrii]